MSLTDVIIAFKTGDYTLTRYAAGTTVDGILTAGAASTSTIEASIQPVSGRDMKIFPEARHSEEDRIVYTVVELQLGDLITDAGLTWEVKNVKHWVEWDEEHWVSLVSKREVTL